MGEVGELFVDIKNRRQSHAICKITLSFESPGLAEDNAIFSGILFDYKSIPGRAYKKGNSLILEGLSVPVDSSQRIALPFKAAQAGDYSGMVNVRPATCTWFTAYEKWSNKVFLQLQVEP